MAAIVWFSGGAFSAENTGSVLRPLFRWLLPGASDAQIAALHALIRKSAHVTEYAILGALLYRALGREALALAVGVAYAATDEFHQHFVRGRHASPLDVAIDAAGVALGMLVWLRVRQR